MSTHPFTPIDLDTWNRTALFRMFRDIDQPHYSITTRLDVTRLVREFVPQGTSAHRACLFAFGCAANAVPAFRSRLEGAGAILYDAVDLSSTVPTQDGAFWFSTFDFRPTWPAFDRVAAAALHPPRSAGDLADTTRRDVVYLSCLPWVDVHGMTHAVSSPDDDIPRISWGRIVEHGDRFQLGCSIAVHHALVDGAHVGAFVQHAQEVLDATAFEPSRDAGDGVR